MHSVGRNPQGCGWKHILGLLLGGVWIQQALGLGVGPLHGEPSAALAPVTAGNKQRCDSANEMSPSKRGVQRASVKPAAGAAAAALCSSTAPPYCSGAAPMALQLRAAQQQLALLRASLHGAAAAGSLGREYFLVEVSKRSTFPSVQVAVIFRRVFFKWSHITVRHTGRMLGVPCCDCSLPNLLKFPSSFGYIGWPFAPRSQQCDKC